MNTHETKASTQAIVGGPLSGVDSLESAVSALFPVPPPHGAHELARSRDAGVGGWERCVGTHAASTGLIAHPVR